ncbi:MAG TPA: tol-pal system protein YbgF [Nitrospirota bacterium]
MTEKLLLTIILSFSLAACVPQAELVKTRTDITDVRQDTKTTKTRLLELQKRVDSLDAGAKGSGDVQRAIADYGVKTDQLSTDINLLQGKLEENNFRITEFGQKLDDKSVKIAELSARVDELEAKIKLLSGGTGMAAVADKDKKAAPKTVDPSEAYRQAKSDYDKGNFSLALTGFQNYLAQFPDATQADMAQYWVGECHYSEKDYSKAIEAFAKVIKTYPKSAKVPGAKLKIGLSYLNEKNNAKAKEYLNRVIKDHPHTTEAEIARERLHKIAK